MLIGIMSDSHDNLSMIERAVSIMNQRKISVLIHAGDFIAPFSIPLLKQSGAEVVVGVYGNNDGEKEGLKKAFDNIGGFISKAPYTHRMNGFSFTVMHEPYFLADAADDPDTGLIVYGHTHKLSIEEKRSKIIVNPGETCGYITGKKTFIMFETDGMKTETVDLG